MKYNAVFRILTNRKYIGEYKFGDIVLPNAMPAIIDEDTFNAVQERMARNKKPLPCTGARTTICSRRASFAGSAGQ